jgi:pimeloyl-ACP methyl ester carboxylesterase
VGIDRPGYGRSTPQPGRTIGGWVPEALAVADRLGINRFLTIGASTGGAYALALASLSARVIGAVACCAVTDMRWTEGKAMIYGALPVWNAPNRETAMALVTAFMGEDGGRTMTNMKNSDVPPSDRALFDDPAWLSWWFGMLPEMFAFGPCGYTDDRLADGPGWGCFDVRAITCPVMVLHGANDAYAPVAHAHYTASIVPHAKLRVVDGLGHFSIMGEIVEALTDVLAASRASQGVRQ